jgi:carboxyl-terminal processing protease
MSAAARQYLDAALDIIQRHAVNRATLDWAAIRKRALSTASGAVTRIDTYAAIASALGQLDDNGHSRFALPFSGTGAPLPLAPSQLPSGRLLPGRIGYVSLPGGRISFADQYQAAGAAVMRRLQDGQPGGWILDLRSDDGGDVWPMLGAIHPLLGSGSIGSFVSPPAPASVIRVTPTELTDGGQVQIRMSAAAQHGAGAEPVVVLIGPTTASSGELVAIVFRGRECATSMGAPTFGVPTGNEEYRLSDGAELMLTTAFDADRTGHVYPDAPIEPDVKVGTVNENATWSQTDPAIRAAGRWLSLHRGCNP